MSNESLVRDLLTLRKELDEIKTTVHSRVHLPANRYATKPAEPIADIVECIATTTDIDRYDVVSVWHNATAGILPKASPYTFAGASVVLNRVGIALNVAAVGEAVKVQVSGTNYARIERFVGTYGAPSTNAIRVGCGLRPSQVATGRAELLRHDDVEGPTFESLDDVRSGDDIVFVQIVPQVPRYRGPFKGSISSDSANIVIGYDRAFVESATQWKYQFSDIISWRYNSSVRTSVRTTADTVVVSADNSYVYYLVTMHPTTLVLTVTLKASTTWPLNTAEGQDVNSRVVVLGKARYVSSKVVSWSQMHYGAIDIKTGNYQSQYGLFPVDVVKQSGNAGDNLGPCTFVYDVKILGTATVIASSVAPVFSRPAFGEFVQADKGTAYVDSSNVVILYQVDEVEAVVECTT